MGIVVQAGQRFASISEMQVGDGNAKAAVGTTVALLERGSKVMSAIHKRLYTGLKKEFKLLSRTLLQLILPPELSLRCCRWCKDKLNKLILMTEVDILPVADPNIFSMSQRITLAQTELQLATSNPQIHNLYAVYRNMYSCSWALKMLIKFYLLHRHQCTKRSKL